MISPSLVKELWHQTKDFVNQIKMSNTERKSFEHTKDHRKRMLRTHFALRKKVLSQYPWWKNTIGVKDDGKIVVISGKNDGISDSRKVVDEMRSNPKLSIVETEGYHETALVEPQTVIDTVKQATG